MTFKPLEVTLYDKTEDEAIVVPNEISESIRNIAIEGMKQMRQLNHVPVEEPEVAQNDEVAEPDIPEPTTDMTEEEQNLDNAAAAAAMGASNLQE